MKRYWVIGGSYADTKFDRMQDGGPEQKFGPFKTYEEAKAEWQSRAWSTVDNACARYRIEQETGDTWYWVVGAPSANTGLKNPADGGGEEWHGPFQTYEDAKIEWSRLAWSTVDDAMCRYRIEKLAYGERPRTAH